MGTGIASGQLCKPVQQHCQSDKVLQRKSTGEIGRHIASLFGLINSDRCVCLVGMLLKLTAGAVGDKVRSDKHRLRQEWVKHRQQLAHFLAPVPHSHTLQ